jgi:copper homeostasis protein
MVADPYVGLDTLIELGIERVLTSGQERSVMEGIDLIAELVERAENRIVVMPGGGVTERNLQRVLQRTKAREIHGSASSTRESAMTHRNSRVFLGGQLGPPEYATRIASKDRVRAFRALAG